MLTVHLVSAGGGNPPPAADRTFTVSISVDRGGSVSGTGQYQWGTTITISAIPAKGYKFACWSGDFSSYGTSQSFNYLVIKNINSAASFYKLTPCIDLINKRSNPLLNMSILGSRNNGVRGGMWGTGRGKMHYGMDFGAEIGEPIYAMFDGVVEQVVDHYDPNIPYEDYKKLYKNDGETNYKAGNRVRIRSNVNGEIITQKYFHMNSVFVIQGPIKAGDIIGYVGNTGSAASEDSSGPHLHLEIYVNGERKDPRSYIYTIFDDNGSITRDCNY